MATKPDNKIVFYSDEFGTVTLVKCGCVERSWYYKGQLTHDWRGIAFDNQMGLQGFYFKKGQVVWLSKSRFKKVPEQKKSDE